jgi:hypothetical protein
MNKKDKLNRIVAWRDNGMVYMEGLAVLLLFPEKVILFSKLRAKPANKANKKRLERALNKIHASLRIELKNTL